MSRGDRRLVELVESDLLMGMDLPDVLVDRVCPLAGVTAIGTLITWKVVALVSIVSVHGVTLGEGLVALWTLMSLLVGPRCLLLIPTFVLTEVCKQGGGPQLRELFY